MKFIIRYANIIAVLILAVSLLLSLGSMRKDSAIRDEMPHIVAGYTYWKFADYRINPEHPPLVKQLSALPLLFQEVNFPLEDPSWKDRVNDQWTLGNTFLYKSGNDADKMIFWGRIPIVILMILTGWVIFLWSSQLFNSKIAGLISVALFAFSPNIIAHGRFITTDMGVTAFSVFALYSWWRFLKNPSYLLFFIAALLQGCLHLAKFSSPLFLPILGIMAIIAMFSYQKKWGIKKRIWFYLSTTILATGLAFLVVGIWYQIFTRHMPLEIQQRLIVESIYDEQFGNAGLATKFINLTEIPLLRPYVQYALGFIMVAAHATYGHTTYFLGEVGQNWPHYYFIAYLLKEPLGSQILFYFSVFYLGIFSFKFLLSLEKKESWQKFFNRYGILLAFVILISMILYLGIKAKLQLGIRYVVTIFPYLYIMIGGIVAYVLVKSKKKLRLRYYLKTSLVAICFIWLIVANLITYPSYLAYFNELIGGPKNGWQYMVDSNLDWGQDLIRLKEYLEENKIKDIKVDYFGGGDLDYYLGKGNYTPWGYDRGPATGWLAVSVDAIQWNSANKDEKKSYHWLTDNYQPIKQIGYSIFVYQIKE